MVYLPTNSSHTNQPFMKANIPIVPLESSWVYVYAHNQPSTATIISKEQISDLCLHLRRICRYRSMYIHKYNAISHIMILPI